MLDEDFIILEEDLKEELDSFKEVCERMGYNFRDRVDDLVDRVESEY